MNLGEQLVPLGVSLFGGAVVGYAGRLIQDLWKRNREAVLSSDEYVLNKIETRFGMAFPKWVHDALNAIVSCGVAAVDKITPQTIREVIRLIGSKKLDKGVDLATRFESWARTIPFGDAVEPVIPEEYKEIINEWKKAKAQKIINAQLAKTLPAEIVAEVPQTKISEMINNAAVAIPANKISSSAGKTTLELIADSQARQARLKL